MILAPHDEEKVKRRNLVLAYLGLVLCASLLIIGALAAIFEEALVVRIYGGLSAVMALVVAGPIARRVWPRKPVAEEQSFLMPRR